MKVDWTVTLSTLRDMFPNIPRSRFEAVCQKYKEERRQNILESAIEYFLTNPDGGDLKPKWNPDVPSIVDLRCPASSSSVAADSDDDGLLITGMKPGSLDASVTSSAGTLVATAGGLGSQSFCGAGGTAALARTEQGLNSTFPAATSTGLGLPRPLPPPPPLTDAGDIDSIQLGARSGLVSTSAAASSSASSDIAMTSASSADARAGTRHSALHPGMACSSSHAVAASSASSFSLPAASSASAPGDGDNRMDAFAAAASSTPRFSKATRQGMPAMGMGSLSPIAEAGNTFPGGGLVAGAPSAFASSLLPTPSTSAPPSATARHSSAAAGNSLFASLFDEPGEEERSGMLVATTESGAAGKKPQYVGSSSASSASAASANSDVVLATGTQPPLFSMYEVKQSVLALFPDIQDEFLEDLIKEQTTDHANRVCNMLLENSTYPRKEPDANKSSISMLSMAASSSSSTPKKDYLTDTSELHYKFSAAVSRLLLFDFPQIAASDIRKVCKMFKFHYSQTRQYIEKCLKENSVVAYADQLISASKPPAGLVAGADLQSQLGALQDLTDQMFLEPLKENVRKRVFAPPPGQHRIVYGKYRKDCVRELKAGFRTAKRQAPSVLIQQTADQLVNEALSGIIPAREAEAEKKKDEPKDKDKEDLVRLSLLRTCRKLASPKGLPLELVEEVEFYENHLKMTGQEKDKAVAEQLNSTEYEETGQLIECNTCYLEVPFDNLVQCNDGHLFCDNCLRDYVKEVMYGTGRSKLSCMENGCDEVFSKSQLLKVLSSADIQKFEEREQEECIALAQMPGLVTCPFCNFRALMAPGDKVFRCEECHRSSCRHCKEDWKEHFGIPCNQIERKDETKFRTLVEEMMTQAKVRKCDRCAMQFYKEDGCNRMTCRCGRSMCYVCRKPSIDYKHFCQHVRNPGSGCVKCKCCSLWSDAKEDDQQATEEVREEYKKRRYDETGIEFDKLIGPPPDLDAPPAKRMKK